MWASPAATRQKTKDRFAARHGLSLDDHLDAMDAVAIETFADDDTGEVQEEVEKEQEEMEVKKEEEDDKVQVIPDSEEEKDDEDNSDKDEGEFDNTIPVKQKLTFHRGMVFVELNHMMLTSVVTPETEALEVQFINYRGRLEDSDDSGGVLRCAINEYWLGFSRRCSGDQLILPDQGPSDNKLLELAAKVFVLGYRLQKYVPPRLPSTFINKCLLRPVTKARLKADMRKMIPRHQDEMISQIAEGDFDDWKGEDMEDFCTAQGVRRIVDEDNWLEVLDEVAHSVILASRAYAVAEWTRVFATYADVLVTVPESRRMTGTVIAKLMTTSGKQTDREKSIMNMLDSFLRKANAAMCRNFLRFVTGFDMVCVEEISVSFYTPHGNLDRRPIAHTCTAALELPNTYRTVTELIDEFDQLFKNKEVFEFDHK